MKINIFDKLKVNKLSEKEIDEMMTAIKNEMAAMTDEIEDLKELNEQVREDNDERIVKLNHELRDHQEELNDRLQQIKEEKQKLLIDLNREEENLKRIGVNGASRKDTITNRYDKVKGLLASDFADKMENLSKIYDQNKQIITADLTAHKEEYGRKMQKQIDKYESLLSQMSDHYERQLKEASDILTDGKQRSAKPLAEMQAEYQQWLSTNTKLDEDHRKKLTEGENDYQKTLSLLKKEGDERLNGYKEELGKMEDKINELLETKRKELLELIEKKKFFDASYKKSKTDIANEKERMMNEYDLEIKDFTLKKMNLLQSEKQAEEELKQLKDKISDLQTSIVEAKGAMEKELREFQSDLNAESDRLKGAYEDKLQEHQAILKSDLDTLRKDLQSQKNDLEAALQDKSQKLKQQLTETKESYHQKIGQLHQEKKDLEASTDQRLSALKADIQKAVQASKDNAREYEKAITALAEKLQSEKNKWELFYIKEEINYQNRMEALKHDFQEKSQELERQKLAVKNEIDQLNADLNLSKESFAKEKAEMISSHESARLDSEQEISRLDSRKRDLEAKIEELKGELSTLDTTKHQLQADHQTLMDKAKEEKAQQEENIKAEFALKCEEITKHFEDEKDQLEREHESFALNIDTRLIDLQNEYEQKTEAINADFVKEKDLIARKKEEINQAFTQNETRLKQECEDIKTQIMQEKSDYETAISDHQTALNALNASQQEKLDALKADFTSGNEQLMQEQNAAVSKIEDELQQLKDQQKTIIDDMAAIKDEHQAAFAVLKDEAGELQLSIDNQKREHEQKLAEKEADLNRLKEEKLAKIASIENDKERYESELKELMQSLNEELDRFKADYDQKKADFTKERQDALDLLISEKNGEEEVLAANIDYTKKTLEEELTAQKSSFDDEIRCGEEENAKLQQSLDQRLAEIEELKNDFKRGLEDEKAKVCEKAKELLTEYNQTKNRLEDEYLSTKKEYDEKLNDLKIEVRQRILALSVVNDEKMNRIKDLEKVKTLLMADNERDKSKLQDLIDDTKKSLKMIEEDYHQKFNDCEREMATLEAESDLQIAELKKTIDNLAAEKEHFKTHNEHAKKAVEKQFDEFIAAKMEEYDQSVKELNQTKSDLIDEYRQKESDLQSQYQKDIELAKADFELKRDRLSQKKAELQQQINEAAKDIGADLLQDALSVIEFDYGFKADYEKENQNVHKLNDKAIAMMEEEKERLDRRLEAMKTNISQLRLEYEKKIRQTEELSDTFFDEFYHKFDRYLKEETILMPNKEEEKHNGGLFGLFKKKK